MTPLARDDPQFEMGVVGWHIEPSDTSIIPAGAPTLETGGGTG